MIIQGEYLKRIQMAELDILKEFKSVCEQYGLRYYLLGGTMLGAVRHQGFIPWDDDIDVGMPRSDYNTFIEKAQTVLPAFYFVQCHKTDPAYPMNFVKIRDSRTTFIETSIHKLEINHGVYIDIFPLDAYPTSWHARKWFKFRNALMLARINDIYTLPDALKNDRITLKDCILRGIAYILYSDVYRAVEKREQLMSGTKSGKLIANHCGAWGDKEIVPAEWYGNGKKVMFEGIEVIVPDCYDRWLTQVYGDYMKLPPEENRVSHHYTEVIDLDQPYIKYRKSHGGK